MGLPSSLTSAFAVLILLLVIAASNGSSRRDTSAALLTPDAPVPSPTPGRRLQSAGAPDKVNPLDVENQNSNERLSVDGTFWTLGINLAAFLGFVLIFEANRFYPQIFLKRCIKRFKDANRVPERPPEWAFGWLWKLYQISEDDILAMVGLDGYMLLRFHVVCLKLCVFLSFWGLLVLTPLYSTAAITSEWDTYTLSNVLKGEESMKFRLWAAAVFGYIFSAYFCKLLQAEYNNFSIRRLLYLTQQYDHDQALEGGVVQGDPDTPQQTYYTVMIERLPKDLRSPQKLRSYFEEIFPGEVFAVEIMLDLSELNKVVRERDDIQNKLEHAIAEFEVSGVRPVVYLPSERPFLAPSYPPYLKDRYLPEITSWWMCLDRIFAPEEYGFEPKDALHEYTNKLIKLNKKVKNLQEPHDDTISGRVSTGKKANKDKDMLELAKEKGTVAGALASKITDVGTEGLKTIRKQVKDMQGFSLSSSLENFLFGPPAQDFNKELTRMERKAIRKTKQKRSTSNAEASNESASSNIFAGAAGGSSGGSAEEANGAAVSNPLHQQPQPQPQPQPQQRSRSNTVTFADSTNMKPSACENEDASTSNSSATSHTIEGLRVETESEEGLGAGPATGSMLEDVDTSTMSPAAFMRKLSLSRKASMSAGSDGELANTNVNANTSTIAGTDGVRARNESETSTIIPFGSTDAFDIPEPPSDSTNMSANVGSQELGLDAVAATASEDQDLGQGLSLDANVLNGSGRGSNMENSSESWAGVSDESNPLPSSNISPLTPPTPTETEFDPSYSNSTPTDPSGAFKSTKKKRSQKGKDKSEGESPNFRSMDYQGGVDMAKSYLRFVSAQARDAAEGVKRGLIEGERLVEMVAWGSFYKLSSTAFVTFRSRITTSIARQMLISHDDMRIRAAPNPKDIIWDNVDKPASLLVMRSTITNMGVIVGSIFWSSLVTEVNSFSTLLNLPHAQQEMLSVVILLCFLLVLPFIFDWLARNYECMKLESEIQNSIMSRYFWYQIVNIYVTVGLGSKNFALQLLGFLRNPQSIVDVLGKSVPAVSLYFCNMMIVKIFMAVPIEMLRPWQLSTIHLMYASMDTRKATRRDLRSGPFYAWPMLYGWVYPQLLMVLTIMVTYSAIAPLLVPFGVIFFAFSYTMYRYQLLYVYINDYQSGGFMFYSVFDRSMVSLMFASVTLLGYLSMQLSDAYLAAPFFFLLPLPFAVLYFWHYCDQKYRRQSTELAYGYGRMIDASTDMARDAGRATPQSFFDPTLYRQPALKATSVYPEKHRSELLTRRHRLTQSSAGSGGDIIETRDERADSGATSASEDEEMGAGRGTRNRRGSISLNVVELVEDGEDSQEQLERYFNEKVVPMSVIPAGHIPGYRDAPPSPPRPTTRRAYTSASDTAFSPLHGGKDDEDADGEGDDAESIDISI